MKNFVGCNNVHCVCSSLFQFELRLAKITVICMPRKEVLGITEEVCCVFRGKGDSFGKDGPDLLAVIQCYFCVKFPDP